MSVHVYYLVLNTYKDMYICIYTISYMYLEEKEEKKGGTQQGVRQAPTIDAMRQLMSIHMLQEKEEETEADGVDPPS